jgi:RimJ/RimL family protein N-acetyltransferase
MIFRETNQDDLVHMGDNSLSRGMQKQCPEQLSYLYTLEDKGNVLGVGGFRYINLHTAWCWVDLTQLAHDNLLVAFRTMRDAIDQFCAENDITRLQAYVECDFPEAMRLVEHLGFIKESTMKNFVGDKDAFMYARCK